MVDAQVRTGTDASDLGRKILIGGLHGLVAAVFRRLEKPAQSVVKGAAASVPANVKSKHGPIVGDLIRREHRSQPARLCYGTRATISISILSSGANSALTPIPVIAGIASPRKATSGSNTSAALSGVQSTI